MSKSVFVLGVLALLLVRVVPAHAQARERGTRRAKGTTAAVQQQGESQRSASPRRQSGYLPTPMTPNGVPIQMSPDYSRARRSDKKPDGPRQ